MCRAGGIRTRDLLTPSVRKSVDSCGSLEIFSHFAGADDADCRPLSSVWAASVAATTQALRPLAVLRLVDVNAAETVESKESVGTHQRVQENVATIKSVLETA
jgi:hypothetical protein